MSLANAAGGASWRRFLYNHNPLYLASAWLALHGVRVALAGDPPVEPGAVVTPLLCGYIAALALAGWLVVRVAKFWEDARSILLVLLIMFAGLSTAYDQLCLRDPAAGARHLLFGFAFCIATTEVVLRAVRVRLAAAYRAPLYLQLGVLFAFPAWLGRFSATGRDPEMMRGVLLFPLAGAVALLALLPATRRDPALDADNGTPWRRPLYPWSIFVFVAAALGVRSWLVSISFSPAYYSSPAFSLYFLAPLAIACSLLALELALRSGRRGAQATAVGGLLAALPLAFPGAQLNAAQAKLVSLAEQSLAGPPQFLAWTIVAACAYAWARRAAGAEWATCAALLFASCLEHNARSLADLHAPALAALAAVAAWQAIAGWKMRSTVRMFVSGAAAIALAGQGVADRGGWPPATVLQLSLAWLALLPLVCRDFWSRLLRRASPWLLAAAALGSTAWAAFGWPAVAWQSATRLTVVAALAAVYWGAWRDRRQAVVLAAAGAAAATLWLVAAIGVIPDPRLQAGLRRYLAGVLILAVAVLVSLSKAGFAARLWHWARAPAPQP